MDPALGLGLGHALHAVGAALELEHRVGALALDRERVLALAHLERLGLEAEPLGVAREHPVEVAGPQPGLLAAGAALDFDDHALLVVGVALDHRQADLLLELLDPLARASASSSRISASSPISLEQLFGAGRIVLRQAPCAGQLGGRSRAGGRRGRPRRSARGRRSPRGRSSARRARRSALSICSTSSSIIAELSVGAARRARSASCGERCRAAGAQLEQLVERRRELLDAWRGRAAARCSPSASSACATGSSRSTTRAPIAPSTLRSSACAQTAPNRPVLAPMTAAGLPRSGLSATGRETQSSAFLSAPGIEPLYSGVATRTASACAIARLQRRDGGRGLRARRPRCTAGSRRAARTARARPRRAAARPRRAAGACCASRARRLPDRPRICIA